MVPGMRARGARVPLRLVSQIEVNKAILGQPLFVLAVVAWFPQGIGTTTLWPAGTLLVAEVEGEAEAASANAERQASAERIRTRAQMVLRADILFRVWSVKRKEGWREQGNWDPRVDMHRRLMRRWILTLEGMGGDRRRNRLKSRRGRLERPCRGFGGEGKLFFDMVGVGDGKRND